MIEWLLVVFSSPSEKAKLISIVVSAILAVSILLLNQWFNSRKSRKELYINKIEELLTTLYSYERLSINIIVASHTSPSSQETVDKMIDGLEMSDKIEMLCSLYLKQIEFNPKDIQSLINKVHNLCLLNEQQSKLDAYNMSSRKKNIEKLQSIIKPIKWKVKGLMSKYA